MPPLHLVALVHFIHALVPIRVSSHYLRLKMSNSHSYVMMGEVRRERVTRYLFLSKLLTHKTRHHIEWWWRAKQPTCSTCNQYLLYLIISKW